MLIAQFVPDASRDILLAPVALTFLSLLLFFLGTHRLQDRLRPLQAIAFLCALFGLFVSLRFLYNMLEPTYGMFYRSALVSKSRLVISHYVGPFIPLAALVIEVVVFRARRRRYEDENGD